MRTPRAKLELYREVAGALREQAQGAAEGVRALPLRVRARARRRAVHRATSSAPPSATGGWDDAHRARTSAADRTRRRERRPRARDRAPPAARSRPRRRGEAHRRRARRSSAPSTRPTARTPTRSPRSSGSTGETGRFSDLLGIYEKKRDLAADPGRAASRSSTRSPSSTRRELKDPTERDRDVPRGARGRADGRAGARRARRALPRARASGSRTSRSCASASSSTSTRQSSSISSSGSARRSRSTSSDAAGALENYREILFLDAGNERRARRARGACSSNAELRAEAAGILEEIYEARGDWEKLIRRARDPRRRRATTSAQARRAAAQDRAHRRPSKLERPRRARSTRTRARSRTIRRNAETRAELEALAERAERLGQARRALQRDRRGPQRRAARARVLDAARRASTSGSARSTRRRRATRTCSRSIPPTPRRSPRWTRSTGAPSAGTISSASSGAASSSPSDGAEREALYAQMAAGLRGEARQARGRDRGLPRGARARPDEPGRARRARRALHAPGDVGRARREPRGAARASPTTTTRSSALMLRLAALRESKMSLVETRDRGLPPGPRARSDERRGARRARAARPDAGARARDRRDPRAALPRSRRLPEAHRRPRGAGPPQRRRRAARSSSSTRSRSSTRTPAAISNSAFDTYARALARGSGERDDAGGPRSPRARHGPLRRSRARLRDARRRRRRTPSSASHALHDERARLRERHRRRRQRHRALPQGARASTRTNLAAAESLERLFRGAERYAELSLILQRKAEILEDVDEKKDALFQAAAIEEDVLERHDSAIAVYRQGPRARRRRICARIDALIKLYLGLSRWERSARGLLARRPISSRDPEEKKLIYYQVGAVYERELGDVPQRDRHLPARPRARSGRPPGARPPRRPLPDGAELAGAPQRPPARGRARERSGRGDQLPVPDRRALREAPRRRRRAPIELYRDILQQSPITSRRSRPSRASRAATKDPLGAALRARARLRRDGRVARSSSASSRCRSRLADDPFAKVELLHRIARLYEESLDDHARGVRHVRARASRSTSPTRTRSRTSSASRWWSTAGRDVAALYDAELDKLAEDPERFVELGLRARADLRDAARGRRERGRALPPRARGRRREPERGLARSIASSRRPSAGAISSQILAREAEIGQTPDEILEFKYRLGQVLPARA